MSKPQAAVWGFLRLYMFSASYDAVAWQTPSPLPAEQRIHFFRHLMLGGCSHPMLGTSTSKAPDKLQEHELQHSMLHASTSLLPARAQNRMLQGDDSAVFASGRAC